MIWYTVSGFKLGIIGWLVIWSKKSLHYGPSATALSGEGIIWQKSGTVVCSMPSVLSSLLTAVHGPSPVAAHFEWQRKRNHLVFDLSATIKETLHLFFSFCATWALFPSLGSLAGKYKMQPSSSSKPAKTRTSNFACQSDTRFFWKSPQFLVTTYCQIDTYVHYHE